MDTPNNPLPPTTPPPVAPTNPPAPKQGMQLTLLNKISIFLVVLILLGLGGYFLMPRTNQPAKPLPTPSMTPTAIVTAIPSPQLTGPADPSGLKVSCNTASPSATLSWNAVPKTDFYFLHVRGKTQEDIRVYGTSHTIDTASGEIYTWWIEAVNHNADFSQSYSSKSIGGREISCP